jgi:nicotinamidase-related amidase
MNQANGGPTPPIQGQTTALLVIDVQQGLFRKSTPIFRAEPLLDTIATLIDRAHAASVLVVYIQHASGKVLPFGSADWQFHPRLHPGEGDLIVHKQHGNAFEDTSLHPELAARDVGSVIVMGLVTHGCVRATCEGALALGYTVVLVADGHSSYSKDAARLVEEWNRKLAEAGAQVLPAAQIGLAGFASSGG